MPIPPDELAHFLADAPPRRLPAAVRRAKLPAATLWIASAVAALVLVGTWPLIDRAFPDRLLDDLRLDLTTPAHAVATVLSVDETGGSVLTRDGSTDRERAIVRVLFRFEDAEGHELEGTSHLATQPPAIDSTVDVEYVLASPEVARVVGSTCSATPRIGALILLMPAIALAWLGRVLSRRRHMRELLVHGRFSSAAVIGLREHPATVGAGRLVATLVSEDGEAFDVDFDGARREAVILRERAAQGVPVGLLRHPTRPQRFVLTDAMADAPTATDIEEEDEDPWDRNG